MIFPVFLSITSQNLCAKYYDPNSVRDLLEAAAYAGLHKAAFALAMCSIFVLITVGDGLGALVRGFHVVSILPVLVHECDENLQSFTITS